MTGTDQLTILLMYRDEQHLLLVVEYILGAVPVMHVPIEHGDTSRLALFQEVFRRNSTFNRIKGRGRP